MLLFKITFGIESGWFNNLILKNCFLEFFKVVSLFSYQGSCNRSDTVMRLFSPLPLLFLFRVSKNYLTKDIYSCQHFFSFFSKKFFINFLHILKPCILRLFLCKNKFNKFNKFSILPIYPRLFLCQIYKINLCTTYFI